MKVLVLSNLFPPIIRGGYELRCARVSELLNEYHDIRVLTSDLPVRTSPGDPETTIGRSVEVARRLPFIEAPTRGAVLAAPGQAARSARILRDELRHMAPDLVYVWNVPGLPQSVIATLLRTTLPIAFSLGEGWLSRLYGSEDPFTRYLFGRRWGTLRGRVVHEAFRGFNAATPELHLSRTHGRPVGIAWVSDFLRGAFVAPPDVKVMVEETILPFSPYLSRQPQREWKPAPDPEFLFSGRVVPEKGIEVAIRALARVQIRFPAARLIVAGPVRPCYESHLRRLARDAGIADRGVEVLGAVGPGELARRLSRAAAAVIPSVWHEPGGLVALDAASAGVPIVASDIGGLPELVRATEALLVPPGDDERLAAALCEVLTHPVAAQRRALRASARSRALSETTHVAKTVSFLARVAAAPVLESA